MDVCHKVLGITFHGDLGRVAHGEADARGEAVVDHEGRPQLHHRHVHT